MLEEIQREIDFIISDRSCADGTDCRVLAYGVFACGDPTKFVPYSANSVDENRLREVAGRYSELSTCLFYRFDVFVDCGIWPDQTPACVEGECVLVEDPGGGL